MNVDRGINPQARRQAVSMEIERAVMHLSDRRGSQFKKWYPLVYHYYGTNGNK